MSPVAIIGWLAITEYGHYAAATGCWSLHYVTLHSLRLLPSLDTIMGHTLDITLLLAVSQ